MSDSDEAAGTYLKDDKVLIGIRFLLAGTDVKLGDPYTTMQSFLDWLHMRDFRVFRSHYGQPHNQSEHRVIAKPDNMLGHLETQPVQIEPDQTLPLKHPGYVAWLNKSDDITADSADIAQRLERFAYAASDLEIGRDFEFIFEDRTDE